MISHIPKTWDLIPGRQRVVALCAWLLQLVAAALEVATIGVVYLFLNGALTPSSLDALPDTIASILAHIPVDTSLEALAVFGIVLFVVRTGFGACAIFLLETFRCVVLKHVSGKLMHDYLAEPYRAHIERRSGDVINNVTTNASNVIAYCVAALLEIAISLTILAVFFFGLVLTSPGPALAGGAVLALFVAFYFLVMRRRLRRWGGESRRASVRLYAQVNEAFGAFKAIKAYGAEDLFYSRFRTAHGRFAELLRRINIVKEVPRLSLEVLGVCGFLTVMLVALQYRDADGTVIAALAAFGMVFVRAMPHVSRVVSFVQLFSVGQPMLDAVHADLTTPVGRDTPSGATRIMPEWSVVSLRDVSFSYRPGQPTLRHVDIDLPRGSLIGLVGPSGSGKTTAVDILMGLLQPESGRVLLDDNEFAAHGLEGPRGFAAYVPQEPVLLDRSLRANVAFTEDEHSVDDERMRRALDGAGLARVLERLPDGFDTVLGERGTALSVGERQRVGIARALYREANIIVLDEPTASQDAAHEAALMRTLAHLRGERTVLVVAHRVTSLREFDRIYLFTAGRVVQSGTFNDLMSNSSAFRETVEHFSNVT